jgi:glycosyltransferase involved in cell wall biosynthesis
MRLAWFSPLPPIRSGIADYSADVLRAIAPSHAVDVFVQSQAELAWGRESGLQVQPAHDFVWRQHRAPYDLTVFQVGNAWCHEYLWPYMVQFPGLVVLHDGQLHHARAWSLLRRRRENDYRAELRFAHPQLSPDAAELAIAGFDGPIYYAWPLLRAVVASARLTAVHSLGLARHLGDEFPDVPVSRVRMGVPDPWSECDRRAARVAIRERHGFPGDAFVLVSFGGITPEKRPAPILRALAAASAYRPDIHVLFVGQPSAHYDVFAEAARHDVSGRITAAGYVSDEELPAYLASADAALCLRWPTARETSASWIRCLAAGLPVVTTDLAHQGELPLLDPRSWTVIHGGTSMTTPVPIAIGIDVLDEDHSLALALRRLAADGQLREALGYAARDYWEGHHSLAHMAGDYLAAVDRASTLPAPAVALPEHFRPDPLAHARDLLGPFGARVSSRIPDSWLLTPDF